MNKKCLVAKVNANSTVSSIICLQDGRIEKLSSMLLKSYNTEDTVNVLICKSDMFLVAPGFIIGSDTYKSFASEKDLLNSIDNDIEYTYLFKNGIWYLNNIELTELI